MARSRKKPIESKSEEPRAEEKPLETVRIRGRAEVLEERDEDIVIARVECTIEGTRVGREHRFGRAFRVRMDDGTSVDVDITHPDVTLVANEKLHKRWSKIEDIVLARPFHSVAPGPDVFTTLEGFVVREGDTVEVFGEVTASAFVEHIEGLREAPETRVAAVRAKIVAAGRDARESMAAAMRKAYPPAERLARNQQAARQRRWAIAVGVASLVLSIGALVWGFGSGGAALQLDAVVTAAVVLSIYVFSFVDDPVLFFVPGGAATTTRLVTPSHLRAIVSYSVAGIAVLVSGGTMFADASTRHETGARASVWLGGITVLVLLVLRLITERERRRDVAILLDSPPFPADVPNGAWGHAAGRVRDLTPVKIGKELAAVAREHDVTIVSGSDPDIVKTSLHNDRTFLVESAHAVFEVFPDNALWATTERDVTKQGDGFLEREIVPVDARIVVAGRVARPSDGGAPQLKSTGKRSLIFFATHAGADPVARLRRFRRHYWLSILFLVASCGAITAAAVTLWPELPPERESSGD